MAETPLCLFGPVVLLEAQTWDVVKVRVAAIRQPAELLVKAGARNRGT